MNKFIFEELKHLFFIFECFYYESIFVKNFFSAMGI